MSVEEQLEHTRHALTQMWSNPQATAERLQQLMARSHSNIPTPETQILTPPPAAAAAHLTSQAADIDEQDLALCAAAAGTARRMAAQPRAAGPANARTTRPAADSDSARMMDLVERAQAGEIEAFGRLYDQYSDTVYRYIYYRVGGKATTEDLTSETFLRALRRIGTFTWQGRDFGAWLVTIARNLVADHFKSSRFRLEVTTDELLEAGECESSAEDRVLQLLPNADLLDAVRRLTPQQQECVTLRFLQGFSLAETARVMGKNEGAVKTLQHRATRRLARLLADDAC
ncbi:ECF subfamily RNA polymerase sigma factor, BldN family [Streptomyces sp. NPDC001910]|uniref:ECF subfamily RNA polymerase sigma factor, BldN family n=1 Tax=Streptomyces sp. NPDC001910 TaxID=3154403 RepID=UPI003331CCAB